MAVTITRVIDDTEFWSSIMGSTEFYNEWWLKVRYRGEADWDKPGTVTITAMGEDNEPIDVTLGLDDLVKAYELVVEKEYHHCGMTVDIDNMDECASDLVLQAAVFGDVIYG